MQIIPANQSCQYPTMLNRPTVTGLGPSREKMICASVRKGFAPTIQAASWNGDDTVTVPAVNAAILPVIALMIMK